MTANGPAGARTCVRGRARPRVKRTRWYCGDCGPAHRPCILNIDGIPFNPRECVLYDGLGANWKKKGG